MNISQNPNPTNYQISVSRRFIEGIVPVSKASNQKTSTVKIRVHSPIQTMSVSWEAICEGSPPEVPHPSLFGGDAVFVEGTQSAIVPRKGENGQQFWAMGGEYHYYMENATGLAADMPTGKMPWEPGSAVENTIPSRFFKQGLVRESGPTRVMMPIIGT